MNIRMNREAGPGGFTLLELLVVLAILLVLAALLFPGLSKAIKNARMIEEMSAGRQLMVAVQLYADDQSGAVFPGYVSDTTALDDQGKPLFFPENARYPWRIVPYFAGCMALIYSGENRTQLTRLQSQSHADYVYGMSVFPSLGINSYFIGGNQTEFPATTANSRFGDGTVLVKLSQATQPDELMTFISARSKVSGSGAQGYYEVTPPNLKTRQWAATYAASPTPEQWGFVSPRFNRHRSVAALLDGHAETFNLGQMEDMRHWCNRADRFDWTLTP